MQFPLPFAPVGLLSPIRFAIARSWPQLIRRERQPMFWTVITRFFHFSPGFFPIPVCTHSAGRTASQPASKQASKRSPGFPQASKPESKQARKAGSKQGSKPASQPASKRASDVFPIWLLLPKVCEVLSASFSFAFKQYQILTVENKNLKPSVDKPSSHLKPMLNKILNQP